MKGIRVFSLLILLSIFYPSNLLSQKRNSEKFQDYTGLQVSLGSKFFVVIGDVDLGKFGNTGFDRPASFTTVSPELHLDVSYGFGGVYLMSFIKADLYTKRDSMFHTNRFSKVITGGTIKGRELVLGIGFGTTLHPGIRSVGGA